MGEHQCRECGHITTGFEDQDFKLMREAEEAKDAEIERLRFAIATTLRESGHLADGDNCTLIHLKRAIAA